MSSGNTCTNVETSQFVTLATDTHLRMLIIVDKLMKCTIGGSTSTMLSYHSCQVTVSSPSIQPQQYVLDLGEQFQIPLLHPLITYT
jgi:hypothetical protein